MCTLQAIPEHYIDKHSQLVHIHAKGFPRLIYKPGNFGASLASASGIYIDVSILYFASAAHPITAVTDMAPN